MPKTTGRPQDLDASVALDGGINTDLSEARPGNGHLVVKGFHGNKRGSLTKWSGMAKFSTGAMGSDRITGMFRVKLGVNVLYFVMAGPTVFQVNPTSAIAILSGQTPAYYDGRVVGSNFYFGSGVNPNKKILQDLTVQNLGIAPPASAPTAADNGAGSLTGTFDYVRTFKNSVTGHESDPSPASGPITVTSRNVLVGGLGGATDPQADVQVLYRTTSSNPGQYFRVVELPIGTTSYSDAVTDGNLGEEVLQDNGVPPQAAYMEFYNSMMVYAGIPSSPNMVAFSGVLRPEAHSLDDEQILDPQDDDVITGLKLFGKAVAIYKNRALYIGSGITPDGIDIDRTAVKEGTFANASIIEFESNHAYLGERGPFIFNGLREQFIGYAIQDFWATLDLGAMNGSSGVYYKPLNMLIWNVKEVGEPDFNLWLCFNTKTKEWTTRPHSSSRLSTFLESDTKTKLWIGGANGVLYSGDLGTSDDGVPIAIELKTRGIGLRVKGKSWDLDALYCFRHVEVHYQPNGGSGPITVQYSIDEKDGPWLPLVNASTGTSTFVPATGNRARFDLNGLGKLIYLRVTGATMESLELKGVRVEGYQLGRR